MVWRTDFSLVLAGVVIAVVAIFLRQQKHLKRSVPDRARQGAALLRIRNMAPWWYPYAEWGSVALMLPVALIVFLGGRLAVSLQVPPTALILLWLYASSIGRYLWRRRRRRVLSRRLNDDNYLICPDCQYSLVAHASGGRCPECGYEFTPDSLIRDWQDVLACYRWSALI